jgi:hypothetical protein
MLTRATVLAPLLLMPGLTWAAELSAACQPLVAAMEKSLLADHNTATIRAGKISHGVTIGGVNYIEVSGAWHKSPMSPKDLIAQSRENLKDAKGFTCSTLPDSIVNGVPVSNYAARTVTEDDTTDNKISISKAMGRLVQVENDSKNDENAHYITQYTYDGVKAPM